MNNKSLATQRASAVVSQIISDQTALTTILNASSNEYDGIHIVNFAGPTGISGLARGDLIYKKATVNLIYATFAEAAGAYTQLISANNYVFWVKNSTSWAKLSDAAISGSYLDLLNKPSGLTETGTYLYSAASSLTGFLECVGANVSRTTYSNLFSVIGTSFGMGDGSITFGTPDLRGRIPGGIGQGSGLSNRTIGQLVGAETHTLSINEIPSHNHSPSLYDYLSGGGSYNGGGVAGGSVTNGSLRFTANTGGGASHNNMQPTLFGGRWFIKT